MRVSVIGSGYVGTTAAGCLAELGHDVVNIDIDKEVVESINEGVAPIHEDGVDRLIDSHTTEGGTGRLRATTEYGIVTDTDVTLVCLPTPTVNGEVELGALEAGVASVGEALSSKGDGDFHVVAVKSTVPPGTVEGTVVPLLEEASGKLVGEGLGVASNPEFLREGSAVNDFLNPDKIVLGTSDKGTRQRMRELYEPLEGSGTEVLETGIRESEVIKYANNTFLATKVSLVNEIANICKEAEVDSYEVMEAVGLDDRVSSRFTRSGLGWGGSCFPKDLDAFRTFGRTHGYEPELLDAAVGVNNKQPKRLVSLLADNLDVEDTHIAVLGLSFKPGTDDVRNSRALDVIEELTSMGANVIAYDPEATENARDALDVKVEYAENAQTAVDEADAAVIATDWEEFEGIGFGDTFVVDGRHIDANVPEERYEGLCW